MIHFDGVTKVYSDNSVALDEVTLSIEPKEFVSIVGQSGAGKTTLLKMILAEEQPTKGKVFFGSTDIHSLKQGPLTKLRQKMGTIFQDFRLLPKKNVFENIAFAMEAAGKTEAEIQSDIPYVLQLVNIERKMWNFPHQLSGGEKQRVAIARAIVTQPDILIADEPTGNLDPVNTYEIIQILKKINDLGTTVVMTTHNKGVVDEIKRRVITMDMGKIVRDDKNGRYLL
jgi:cell division transport system ATP-binding protein